MTTYTVSAGVTSSGIALHPGDDMAVLAGGTAVGTTISSAEQDVFGTASDTTVGFYGGQQVSAGGVAVATTVASGGKLQVYSGGTAIGGTVQSGGLLTVSAGGSNRQTIAASGGVEGVGAGGTQSGDVVQSGGFDFVFAGGTAEAVTVEAGGTLIIQSGGLVSTPSIAAGGVVINGSATMVSAGQIASGLTVQMGDSVAVLSGGSAVALTETFAGFVVVQSGGVAVGATVYNEFDVAPGGTALDTTLGRAPGLFDGGWLLVSSGAVADGITLAAGGAMELGVGALTSGIVFAGSAAYLMIDAYDSSTMPSVTLSGFAVNDTIDFDSLYYDPSASATLLAGNVLQVADAGTTLDVRLNPARNFAGASFFVTPDYREGGVDVTTNAAPCFRAGTRIRTPRGEVPVEALRAGDTVLLAQGGTRPVRWIGRRHVDCRRHPRPHDVWPVRVAAGAFAEGQPIADLWLSPDHAVLVGGALIPVRYLLNGATIRQERAASVSYFHVELDAHDALLAEGLPCESYLDTGNRAAFADGGAAVHLHPDFALHVWQARGYAPLIRSGDRLAAARGDLLARAQTLGHRMTDAPGLCVMAGDRRLPAARDGRVWRVRSGGGAGNIRLVSRVWVPAHMHPAETDTRPLGVALSRLWLDGRAVGLDSPALGTGWHAAEPDLRWTDGAAVLLRPAAEMLAFELAMTGSYWLEARSGARCVLRQ